MDIWESIGLAFSTVMLNTVTNYVLIVLNVFTLTFISYNLVNRKDIHTKIQRVGYLLITLGLVHNLLLRLQVLDYLDPFLLINVPSIVGYTFIQLGMSLIVLRVVLKSIKEGTL